MTEMSSSEADSCIWILHVPWEKSLTQLLWVGTNVAITVENMSMWNWKTSLTEWNISWTSFEGGSFNFSEFFLIQENM